MLRTLSFVETATGVTYTARTSVPPGARLMDILVETTVAWTAATAPLDIGDSDATDALFNNFDIAAAMTHTSKADGGTQWFPPTGGPGDGVSDARGGKLYPSGDIITAVVSPTVPGGPTGISLITLWIELPTSNRAAVVV